MAALGLLLSAIGLWSNSVDSGSGVSDMEVADGYSGIA